MAETMFLMISADGDVSPEELDADRGAIRGLIGDLLHTGTINVMTENYAKARKSQGRNARLKQIAENLAGAPEEAEGTEGAFAMAAAVALADNKLHEAEHSFIQQLAEWFQIAPQRCAKILDQLEDERPSA